MTPLTVTKAAGIAKCNRQNIITHIKRGTFKADLKHDEQWNRDYYAIDTTSFYRWLERKSENESNKKMART